MSHDDTKFTKTHEATLVQKSFVADYRASR